MSESHTQVAREVASVERVLATIPQLYSQMKEAQTSCERLYGKVQTLLTKILSKGPTFSKDLVDKYAEIVFRYLRFLDCHRTMDLVRRVITHQALVDELSVLNEEASELFRSIGVESNTDWEEQLKEDGELLTVMTNENVGVLHELQEPRAQVEAWLTLKLEIERRGNMHHEESMKLMHSTLKTIGAISTITLGLLSPWFLPATEFTVETKPFGRGSLGSVYHGVLASTPVVVKFFRRDDVVSDEGMLLKMERELSLLYEMTHPNVVKVFGASHVNSPPFIVYDDIANGNLGSFLARSEDNKRQMWGKLVQAAVGLDYIHKKGMAHGNLKLSNMLVGLDGQVKLTDFGLGTLRTYLSGATALRWCAPECLKRRPTFASDVYSFAMCIIEAVTGEPPFAFLNDDDVRGMLRNGDAPDKPDEMPGHVWNLVGTMIKADRFERPQLQQVIDKLDFFADIEGINRQELFDEVVAPATTSDKQKRSVETERESPMLAKRVRHK